MQTYSKIKVQLSFFSRLAVIVFSILTVWALSRARMSTLPNTTIALPVVFGQLELCMSLSIATILPCFRLLFQSSEREAIGSRAFPGDEIKIPDSYTMGSVETNTSTVAPLPRKAEHSAASSQDMSGAISEASFVPSGHTNQSQRPFVV
jgi:hypothetical protein